MILIKYNIINLSEPIQPNCIYTWPKSATKLKIPLRPGVSGTNEIWIWILVLGPCFFSKIDLDALLATFGVRKTCTANLGTKLYHQKKIFAPDNPPTRTIDRKRWEIAVFQ